VSNFLNNLLCQSKRLAITGAVVLLTAPFAAKADTASTTMAVTALVLKVCVVAATPMVFGNYTATNSTPTDATSTIVVTCTNGTTYDVALDAGIGTGATTTTRKLSFLTNTLNYQLFSNASHSQNWGNTSGTDTVAGSGSGLIATHTVYGRMSQGQYDSPGAYLDTITVTVNY